MGYRVRNQYGELQFGSFDALKDAYEKNLVEPDDEVLENGSSQWRKASSWPKLVAARHKRTSLLAGPARWYLIAVAVFLVGVGLVTALRSGIIGFGIVLAVAMLMTGVFTWMGARAKRNR
ncbi:MAG: hypothetical protein WBV82_24100 [Myxococcaceae bacterium]